MNSGTDALTLGLHILGVRKGDEVITLPNSFIASTAVIVHSSAKLIFVDIKEDQNISLGGSSGINIAGAIKLAKQMGPGHNIVTILCDPGKV